MGIIVFIETKHFANYSNDKVPEKSSILKICCRKTINLIK